MYEAPPPVEPPALGKRLIFGLIASLLIAGLVIGLLDGLQTRVIVGLAILLVINGLNLWAMLRHRD